MKDWSYEMKRGTLDTCIDIELTFRYTGSGSSRCSYWERASELVEELFAKWPTSKKAVFLS